MQIVAILAAASMALSSTLKEPVDQGCIFKAVRSSYLKIPNYRTNCRKNLEEQEYDHWLLDEEDGRLIWQNYEGDEDMKEQILKSDCDHILESQVLFNYIHKVDAEALCPLFDEEGRSTQVRAILNGKENMRFINKEINMAKGQIFGPSTRMAHILKLQKENHFAEALDEYIYNVQPSYDVTKSKINQIFADFLIDYPQFNDQFNGTFITAADSALNSAHMRLEGIIAITAPEPITTDQNASEQTIPQEAPMAA